VGNVDALYTVVLLIIQKYEVGMACSVRPSTPEYVKFGQLALRSKDWRCRTLKAIFSIEGKNYPCAYLVKSYAMKTYGRVKV
jgi:hypothetical protein